MSRDEDERDEPDREGEDRFATEHHEGLSERVTELAQALLGNPLVNQALGSAFGAREKALGAQRVAMGALDIPSASDLQRLERRLRAIGDRIEAVEGEVDRLVADVRMLREARAAGSSTGSDPED